MPDSLQPHGLQPARLLCPPVSPSSTKHMTQYKKTEICKHTSIRGRSGTFFVDSWCKIKKIKQTLLWSPCVSKCGWRNVPIYASDAGALPKTC